MGYGDYLMLSGKVRVLKQTMPNEQLCCPTLEDRFYFESVFFNNQNIVRSENIDNSKRLLELGQLSLGIRKEEAGFIDWNVSAPPIRGDIYFTKDELNIAENFISDAKLGFKAKHKTDPLKIIFLSPYTTIKKIVNGKIKNFCVNEKIESRRQDLKPKAFVRAGAIYTLNRDYFMKNKKRYGSIKSYPYILPDKRAINIDEENDFLMAETLIKNEK